VHSVSYYNQVERQSWFRSHHKPLQDEWTQEQGTIRPEQATHEEGPDVSFVDDWARQPEQRVDSITGRKRRDVANAVLSEYGMLGRCQGQVRACHSAVCKTARVQSTEEEDFDWLATVQLGGINPATQGADVFSSTKLLRYTEQ
jgi:hypothetical protein